MLKCHRNRLILSPKLDYQGEFEAVRTALAVDQLVDVQSVLAIAEKAIELVRDEKLDELEDLKSKYQDKITEACTALNYLLSNLGANTRTFEDKLVLAKTLNEIVTELEKEPEE